MPSKLLDLMSYQLTRLHRGNDAAWDHTLALTLPLQLMPSNRTDTVALPELFTQSLCFCVMRGATLTHCYCQLQELQQFLGMLIIEG